MSILKKIFRITPFRVSLAIAVFFLGLSLLFDFFPERYPLLQTIADKSLDYKFRLRGPVAPKTKIVIVAADDKAFETYGQWPFDRGSVMAPLIENVCKYNPKVVGFDMVWSETEKVIPHGVKEALGTELGSRRDVLDQIISSNSGDTLLRKALEFCAGKTVLGYAFRSNIKPQPDFEKRAELLVNGSHNTLNAITTPGTVFARGPRDPDANVEFYNVASAGILNIPSVTPPGVAQGFFSNDEDNDGNYRRATFTYAYKNHMLPSLAFRMAQKYLNPDDAQGMVVIKPNLPEKDMVEDFQISMMTPSGRVKLPVDLEGHALVNFRGPNKTFPNVSLADVLKPVDTLEYDLKENGVEKHYKVHKSEFFKDALVLVGVTASAIYDIRPRPFDPLATGVENHANILDNLITDSFLSRPTTGAMITMLLSVFGFSLLFGFIVSRLGAVWGALGAVVTIAGTLYFDQVYLFNQRGIVILGHLTAIQMLFQYLGITVMKYMNEESEKKFIRSAFDKYVSPDVINQMISDPGKLRIGGDKKELSILFSDIRGFTTLSERLDVKALATFLNEYLGAMTDILQAHGGTLDKYIGDAVMGFWGAPLDSKEHARLATKTALEMVVKLDELNKSFQEKYGLTIDIGIGINTGPVTVGNFGSSKVFSYTVIGDNVNLASRLEGVNKEYGTKIIVSETTFAQLPQGEFLTREVDTVKVKGKHKPVKIYEVFPDTATYQPLKDMLKTFNEGLKHYYARQWEQAMSFFQAVLQNRAGDKPSLELISRCKHYLTSPPEADWDGSWEMHTK